MKIIFLLITFFSLYSKAALVSFSNKSNFKAVDLNNNFNYIKSILNNKNVPIIFRTFQSGELILKDVIESEFNKLRILGIEVDNLNAIDIKSSELNAAFSQSKSGAENYDDIPVVNNFAFSLNEDSGFSGSSPVINLVGSNQFQVVSNPSNGQIIAGIGNSFSYQPNQNFNGSDSFSYRIFDGTHYSEIATATITVIGVNDNPIANSQSIVVTEDTPKSIILEGYDPDNTLLEYEIVSSPTKGTLTGTLPNITYQPHSNEVGEDFFSFKVKDGFSESNIANVNLSIAAVNDAPQIPSTLTINTQQNSAAYNDTITVIDPDSNNFTFSIIANPTKGIANVNNSGLFSYTPSLNTFGSDSFQVRVSDGNLNSNILTINITINGSGLIIANGARTYYDGSVATSCNDYRTKNQGLYNYSGSTGDGLYTINPDNGVAFNVYCDMTREGGGWTMIVGFYGNSWDMSYYDNSNVGWKSTNGSGTFGGTNLNYVNTYWSPAYARLKGDYLRISNNNSDRLTWNLPSNNSLRTFVESSPTNYSAASGSAGFAFNSSLSSRVSGNSSNLAWRWNYTLKVRCADGRGGGTDNAVLGFTSDQYHSGYYCEGYGYPPFGNHEFRRNSRWYGESVNTGIVIASNAWRSDTLYYNVWIR